LGWSLRVVLIALLSLVVSGCTPTIQFGKPPLTDRLDMLKINVSTRQDIKAALGEPQGHGAVRSPGFGVKEAWLYECTISKGTQSHLQMLMVFLDKERGIYQGHLWFKSGMLIGQTK